MHKHPDITLRRIQQFIEFQLKECLISEKNPLKTQFLPGAFADAATAQNSKNWQSIEPGFVWGPTYQEGWYRIKPTPTRPAQGFTPVLMYGPATINWENHPNCEGTIWENNVTVGGLDFGHPFHRLDPKSKDLLIQTYAHNKETTVHRPEKPRTPEPEEFKGFYQCLLNENLLPLFYDAEFTANLVETLKETDPARATLLRALNEVCNTYQADKPKTIATCRKIIKTALGSINVELKHTVHAFGHAHLDTAWLWPLSVTRLKMAHTTTLQLGLAERYPEHLYLHSQASQYEWIQETNPNLFNRVKQAAKKGNWEAVGSMYVEADCNLTGAESLVRQFLYGRRYFREHFGHDTPDMFLPDVFGYSAALPQILKKFNIKAFITQKMSWNQFNKIPHNTFWWQGIDGSSIWTHFPPADTYISNCSPQEIIGAVEKHRDQARSDSSLLLFGFGDGGGGPTEWHIERLRRAADAPCLPHVETKGRYRDTIHKMIEESEDLQTWQGELYFEYHRGTYTSQAANKAKNRLTEFLLRDAELLASIRDDFPKSYPSEDLTKAWKLVLLNQFHDIIPGSSVKEVYEDSAKDYQEIERLGDQVITSALKHIGDKLDTTNTQNPYAIYHNADLTTQGTMPWTDPESAPKSIIAGDEKLPVQFIEDQNGPQIVFPIPIAAQGIVTVADFSSKPPTTSYRLKSSSRKIENNDYSVRFDSNGNITSIQSLDENPTEFVHPDGLANVFQILDDRPLFWDAWDVDIYSQETAQDLLKSDSFELVENGPVRTAVELVKTFGKSTIRQRISLGPTPGIRFDTWVDWHEDHKMLKVAFPLNVNTNRASFEIQFGHVERPTHRNTSWDLARFEVCAQKWADLSEGGHGAAIINTGKYGHDVHGSTLRLSLLRSPKAPDPTCDMGQHFFSYVLYPHYDQVQHSDVIAAAYAVNAPLRYVPLQSNQKGSAPSPHPFVATDNRSLIIESVKKAEDSNLRVIRLYECHNTRGSANLCFNQPIARAYLADLEENIIEELEIMDGNAKLDFNPFEILTILVEA